MSAPALSAEYVRSVWEAMAPHVKHTTLVQSDALDEVVGASVVLACETFQHTGSFKYRAAYNLLRSVPNRLIVTASSGNFGQAAALASRQLGKACIVVMPSTSAQVKIDAVGRQQAAVDLVDTSKMSRMDRVNELMDANPSAFYAPAFDDTRVVAGNSTLGREIFSNASPLDVVVAPVGGGGLISGIVTARDVLGVGTPVIGAEPALGNDAARSFHGGALVANETEPSTIADGARTLALGAVTWPIVRDGLEEIFEIPDATIAEAVRLLFGRANVKAEPTGALALGALLVNPGRFAGKRVCCVVSGGNVDEAIYASILKKEI